MIYLKYLLLVLLILIVLKFISKKIKKYKKIHEKNGFDGIYYYFLNKNIKKSGFNNFVDISSTRVWTAPAILSNL